LIYIRNLNDIGLREQSLDMISWQLGVSARKIIAQKA